MPGASLELSTWHSVQGAIAYLNAVSWKNESSEIAASQETKDLIVLAIHAKSGRLLDVMPWDAMPGAELSGKFGIVTAMNRR